MTVFVLTCGIIYEGSDVFGVFASQDAAEAAIDPDFVRNADGLWESPSGICWASISAHDVKPAGTRAVPA